MISEAAIAEAGVFSPSAVRQLWTKSRGKTFDAQLSNADNMALVGVLSTQLLFAQLVREPPPAHLPKLTTLHDTLHLH